MNTVPTATTVPTGMSDGSLHVSALSPLRAAALPLIFTVWLPIVMVALFAGGLWKLVPGGVGMWAGELSAVLSTVAAGFPMIFTFSDNPPEIFPVKRCGNGIGTGDGQGTITICVSVAMIWSSFFAAGCPISTSV
ncbi:MAG: hypothetical protein JEZ06_08065 [Anaerolineaceae bacterium]|nr:hypothetical protein [Anaerolineaceae bacterium]